MVHVKACTDCAKPTARLAQLEGDLHAVNGKLDFSERRDGLTDSWYSMLSNQCNLLKSQIASGEVCSGEIVQIISKASYDVNASIHDLYCHAAHAQK